MSTGEILKPLWTRHLPLSRFKNSWSTTRESITWPSYNAHHLSLTERICAPLSGSSSNDTASSLQWEVSSWGGEKRKETLGRKVDDCCLETKAFIQFFSNGIRFFRLISTAREGPGDRIGTVNEMERKPENWNLSFSGELIEAGMFYFSRRHLLDRGLFQDDG